MSKVHRIYLVQRAWEKNSKRQKLYQEQYENMNYRSFYYASSHDPKKLFTFRNWRYYIILMSFSTRIDTHNFFKYSIY